MFVALPRRPPALDSMSLFRLSAVSLTSVQRSKPPKQTVRIDTAASREAVAGCGFWWGFYIMYVCTLLQGFLAGSVGLQKPGRAAMLAAAASTIACSVAPVCRIIPPPGNGNMHGRQRKKKPGWPEFSARRPRCPGTLVTRLHPAAPTTYVRSRAPNSLTVAK